MKMLMKLVRARHQHELKKMMFVEISCVLF